MQPDEMRVDTGARSQQRSAAGQGSRNRSVANPRRTRLAARDQVGAAPGDASSASSESHAA